MIDDGIEDRASECARCMHALAIGSPLIFSNPEALTKWFEAILRHEHEVAFDGAAVEASPDWKQDQAETSVLPHPHRQGRAKI